MLHTVIMPSPLAAAQDAIEQAEPGTVIVVPPFEAVVVRLGTAELLGKKEEGERRWQRRTIIVSDGEREAPLHLLNGAVPALRGKTPVGKTILVFNARAKAPRAGVKPVLSLAVDPARRRARLDGAEAARIFPKEDAAAHIHARVRARVESDVRPLAALRALPPGRYATVAGTLSRVGEQTPTANARGKGPAFRRRVALTDDAGHTAEFMLWGADAAMAARATPGETRVLVRHAVRPHRAHCLPQLATGDGFLLFDPPLPTTRAKSTD